MSNGVTDVTARSVCTSSRCARFVTEPFITRPLALDRFMAPPIALTALLINWSAVGAMVPVLRARTAAIGIMVSSRVSWSLYGTTAVVAIVAVDAERDFDQLH